MNRIPNKPSNALTTIIIPPYYPRMKPLFQGVIRINEECVEAVNISGTRNSGNNRFTAGNRRFFQNFTFELRAQDAFINNVFAHFKFPFCVERSYFSTGARAAGRTVYGTFTEYDNVLIVASGLLSRTVEFLRGLPS